MDDTTLALIALSAAVVVLAYWQRRDRAKLDELNASVHGLAISLFYILGEEDYDEPED